jgi:hypothetical protein
MKRFRFQATILATALILLAVPGLAAPRVALVIPISGPAKLAGTELVSPRIAEEGQQLSLDKGAEVRLQLLGSSKEKVLKGKSTYIVQRARLEQEGKDLERGSISMTSEIGNLSRAGAGTTRATGQVGLVLNWPPERDGELWISAVTTPVEKQKLSERSPVSVTLTDLSDPEAELVEATLSQPVTALAFREDDLDVNHRYRVDVVGDAGRYSRDFRFLSAEEQESLRSTEESLKRSIREHGEIPTLIRLASLYNSFDQTEKMADVLLQATQNAGFSSLDKDVRQHLVDALNRTRKSLDLGPIANPFPD